MLISAIWREAVAAQARAAAVSAACSITTYVSYQLCPCFRVARFLRALFAVLAKPSFLYGGQCMRLKQRIAIHCKNCLMW
eukprot:6191865-Pleurochrysis_carterae.AAC.2